MTNKFQSKVDFVRSLLAKGDLDGARAVLCQAWNHVNGNEAKHETAMVVLSEVDRAIKNNFKGERLAQ